MLRFQVQGMTCGHCVQSVTKAVHSVDAKAQVQVDLAGKRVSVEGRDRTGAVAQVDPGVVRVRRQPPNRSAVGQDLRASLGEGDRHDPTVGRLDDVAQLPRARLADREGRRACPDPDRRRARQRPERRRAAASGPGPEGR